MKTSVFSLATLIMALAFRAAGGTELPPYVPDYYRSLVLNSNSAFILVSRAETNGVTQFLYTAAYRHLFLSIEHVDCAASSCEASFGNILANLNGSLTNSQDKFIRIDKNSFEAKKILGDSTQSIFAFMLPDGITIWQYGSVEAGPVNVPDFPILEALVDRQRYETAFRTGNVDMGKWGESVHRYARQLLSSGKTNDALVVYDNLLSTSPYDYEAHLEDAAITTHGSGDNARAVFNNAEDSEQIAKAAKFLGQPEITLDSWPPLATNEQGLQVILIPVAPCNPWILEQVATVYQRITGVPIKIRRLEEPWSWGKPERFSRQRQAQGLLTKLEPQIHSFDGWTKDQYLAALKEPAGKPDAFSRYWCLDLVDKINSEPGQFSVEPYAERFSKILRNYRSGDARTMYVAVTEANIYAGDVNYLFSVGGTGPNACGFLSYYMMLGKTLGQDFDSRQRLVERIAKELVPASLKQLGIPRSTDPTCPYSYSSGVERLDQKTLMLSGGVKEALRKLGD